MPNIVICYKNPKLNNTDIPPCQQPKPFTEWKREKLTCVYIKGSRIVEICMNEYNFALYQSVAHNGGRQVIKYVDTRGRVFELLDR